MIAPDEIERVKASVDILSLAERYTKLRKCAQREYAGACPRCGGRDRFHVHTDGWWFCRQCHERRGDVIDLVRFVEGSDFVAACEALTTGVLRTVTPVRPRAPEKNAERWREPDWQQSAFSIVNQAAVALDTDAGTPGRAYLEQRGISMHTAWRWVIGYVEVSPPWSKEQRRRVGGPSITLPYIRHDSNDIMAVRYRRISPSEDRYINEAGSNPVLFGLHRVDLNADTLIIVEGELNAISIWQASHEHDLGLSVVSIGAQSVKEQQLKAVAWLSKRFSRCVVWCDEPRNALDLRDAAQSPTVIPWRSPHEDGEKVDANDMLRRGLLRLFLTETLQEGRG